jgi:hypothetical protein
VTIAESIYLLCAATSLTATVLLTRHYLARRTALLFWSSIAFAGFSLNNILVYVDLAVLPGSNLALVRSLLAMLAMLALVFGLTKEVR